jgi:hypothetical protein
VDGSIKLRDYPAQAQSPQRTTVSQNGLVRARMSLGMRACSQCTMQNCTMVGSTIAAADDRQSARARVQCYEQLGFDLPADPLIRLLVSRLEDVPCGDAQQSFLCP